MPLPDTGTDPFIRDFVYRISAHIKDTIDGINNMSIPSMKAMTGSVTVQSRGRKLIVRPKKSTVGVMNKSARTAVKRIVKRSLERTAEIKYKDLYDNVAAAQSATLLAARDMTSPSQGNGDTQRVGDTIMLTSVQINLQMTATAAQVIRLIVFKWKPLTTSYLPKLGDILQSPANTAVGPVYQRRVDTQGNYTILYDKAFALQNVAQQNRIIRINLTKKLGQIRFDAGSTDGVNKLFYFLITDIAASNSISMYTRIRFKDM